MSLHSSRRLTTLVLQVCGFAALAITPVAHGQLFPRLAPSFEVPDCGIPCHTNVGALDGNTAVVVSSISHAVQVFTRDDSGTWSQTATLFDPAIAPPPPPEEGEPPQENPYENSNFGGAVALKGPLLLVASSAPDDGAPAIRKVYLFRRAQQQWLLRQTIDIAPAAGADAFFITSLAFDRNTALIGTVTWTHDAQMSNERGAVHVFTRTPRDTLRHVTTVSPAGIVNANFGAALDVQGDTFAVGANLRDEHRGAVYVYGRRKGTWKLDQRLDGATASAEFGRSLALSRRTLAVGAPASGVPRSTLEGQVHVFAKQGAKWRLRQTLLNPLGDSVPEFTVPLSTFGATLDFDGRRLIASGDFPFNEPGTPFAAAFLFERDDGRWNPTAEFGNDPPSVVDVSRGTALLLQQTRFGAVPVIYQLPPLAVAAAADEESTGADD